MKARRVTATTEGWGQDLSLDAYAEGYLGREAGTTYYLDDFRWYEDSDWLDMYCSIQAKGVHNVEGWLEAHGPVVSDEWALLTYRGHSEKKPFLGLLFIPIWSTSRHHDCVWVAASSYENDNAPMHVGILSLCGGRAPVSPLWMRRGMPGFLSASEVLKDDFECRVRCTLSDSDKQAQGRRAREDFSWWWDGSKTACVGSEPAVDGLFSLFGQGWGESIPVPRAQGFLSGAPRRSFRLLNVACQEEGNVLNMKGHVCPSYAGEAEPWLLEARGPFSGDFGVMTWRGQNSGPMNAGVLLFSVSDKPTFPCRCVWVSYSDNETAPTRPVLGRMDVCRGNHTVPPPWWFGADT